MSDPKVPNPDAPFFDPPKEGVGYYFPLDKGGTPPADDTFEIGLVLGGTVSAAAYTAGVLDFLIEALDTWTVAREAGAGPEHKVRIKILAGTSGGAISCTLLTRVMAYAFPHVTADTPAAKCAGNPFYDCWVNQIDITDLLKLTDTKNGLPPSILCPAKIDYMGVRIATYPCIGQPDPYPTLPLGEGGTPPVRDYLEQSMPVVLTMTNLRGIPYATNFNDKNRPEYYTDHADHARFVVDITGKNPPQELKPYEIGVSESGGAAFAWTTMIEASRCSSAFPLGFPPKTFIRALNHYRYRFAVREDIQNGRAIATANWLQPAWDYMTPTGDNNTENYTFLSVDGGCLNNEPTEYARQHLAGVLGHNERDGSLAHRAVLLVDPFADTPDYGLDHDQGIVKTAGATLTTFVATGRYQTADLELFQNEKIFSRFLITPARKVGDDTLTGGNAIATDSVGAFGGFLSKAYRHHDFMLGRRNCQRFLMTSFMLPRENSLFAKWRDSSYSDLTIDDTKFLPIIPVMGDLREEIKQPDWPKNAFRPQSIRSILRARLATIGDDALKSVVSIPSWIPGVSLLKSWAANKAVDKAIAELTAALQKANLLDKA